MTTITADQALQSILTTVTEITEIRDRQGNFLGLFTPKEKADEETKKLFDLDRARETLAKEKDQCRPFLDMIAILENRTVGMA